MVIRKAAKDDIDAIKKLYWLLDTDAVNFQPEHFVRAERSEDFILSIIENDKSDFLTIEEDNEVIGFSFIKQNETASISCLKKQQYAYIQDFVIAEAYRDRGYGSKLLEASKDWSRQRGLEFLKLSVFPQNEKGITFYERHGLKETMRTMECDL